MKENIFHILMKDLCSEMGIKLEILSYGWILQLSKNEKIRHITGSRFDNNPEATGNIACDKYATYEVLKSQHIPIIEHSIVFNPAQRSSYIPANGLWQSIIDYYMQYGPQVVVKPNNGSEGQGVCLCNNIDEVKQNIENLFKTNSSLSICPYYDITTEYRTFYLDEECLLTYGKTKPFVIGDGVHTVADLIAKLNLPDNNIVKENIGNIDTEYIPSSGEKVEISWKHNLSGGATPKILEDGALKTKIETLVKAAGHAMNIKFATIDIIQTSDNELLVMEVNSGVCMTHFIEHIDGGYEIAKAIYKKALEKLFN